MEMRWRSLWPSLETRVLLTPKFLARFCVCVPPSGRAGKVAWWQPTTHLQAGLQHCQVPNQRTMDAGSSGEHGRASRRGVLAHCPLAAARWLAPVANTEWWSCALASQHSQLPHGSWKEATNDCAHRRKRPTRAQLSCSKSLRLRAQSTRRNWRGCERSSKMRRRRLPHCRPRTRTQLFQVRHGRRAHP